MAAVWSGGASQTSALKISTSTSPSYPAAATLAAMGAKSITPSPRWPRPSRVSAGSGSTQSHTWKLTIRRPARAISSASRASHQTW